MEEVLARCFSSLTLWVSSVSGDVRSNVTSKRLCLLQTLFLCLVFVSRILLHFEAHMYVAAEVACSQCNDYLAASNEITDVPNAQRCSYIAIANRLSS